MTTTTDWDRYRAEGDTASRNALVEENLRLVHHVARQLMSSGGRRTELDDMISAGTVGLMEAVEKFDPSRGLAFSTFAAPRIRGAILDDCRRQDRVPRSIRRKQRDIRRSEESLAGELGRAPTESEIAHDLDIDVHTLERWRREVLGADWKSLDDTVGDDDRSATFLEVMEGSSGDDIEAEVTHSEEMALVRETMDHLTEQERTVLGLYYFEGLKLHQIAGILGVTESRISQVRSKALRTLKTRLAHLREV